MKKAIISVFILAALIISFLAGLRMGGEKYLLANSSNDAFILSNELRMLRSGNIENVIYVKELELSSQIRFHEEFLNSNFKWLYSDITQYTDINMRKAIKYRLENPYEIPSIDNTDVDFSNHINQGLEEVNESVDRMQEKYK